MMQLIDLIAQGMLQTRAKHFREKVVITVVYNRVSLQLPFTLIIQAGDEQIGMLQAFQNLLSAGFAGDDIA